ncbi:MAG: hypothetical protein BroJett041_23850 [Candidatus Jettenia caeni]|nr:MAG: hypothetical protein BroJett041_23850 [Candidatus Jettenia caeni]
MLQTWLKVKRISPFILVLLSSCAHQQSKIQDRSEWRTAPFIPHDTWLAINVDPKPADQIRSQLDQLSQMTHKHRGEAHITIITPPEYEKLKKYISMTEINKIALDSGINQIQWRNICLGSGAINFDGKTLKTYFVVVDSPELVRFREVIEAKAQSLGARSGDFKAQTYYPHITIGFTDRDLHESDGVIKDEKSCNFELVDPMGFKIK